MFVNRMNLNKLRGRPIANDSVQSLSLTITDMHSHLIKNVQDEEDTFVWRRWHQYAHACTTLPHILSLPPTIKLVPPPPQFVNLEALQDKLNEIKDARAALDALRQQQMANKLEIMSHDS